MTTPLKGQGERLEHGRWEGDKKIRKILDSRQRSGNFWIPGQEAECSSWDREGSFK